MYLVQLKYFTQIHKRLAACFGAFGFLRDIICVEKTLSIYKKLSKQIVYCFYLLSD